LMIVVVVMIALPTRWSFYESDNNTAQGLLWFYMDGIQSRRAQTFFLTVSNILCVNNWNDSLGKWGFFFLQKGTHTTHAHLLPGVELCSLRSIPDSRLSRHRNDAPLHRATPPTPTIYYPHHLFFFFFSLKLNYSPERHGTFSRLLASIKAVVNVLQAGASDSLTSTEERGEKNVWMNHATWISYRSPFSTFLSLLGLVPQSLIAGNIPLIWWLVPAVNLGIPLPRWHSWLYRKLNDKVFNHSTHVLLAGAIRKPRGVAKLSFEKLQIQSRTGN
jgi:hypothetical protein